MMQAMQVVRDGTLSANVAGHAGGQRWNFEC